MARLMVSGNGQDKPEELNAFSDLGPAYRNAILVSSPRRSTN